MVVLPESECPLYFTTYLKLVEEDILEQLEMQLSAYAQLVALIPKAKELYAYADGKWTIKEVLGHITDTERIMFFRAFCIARGDKTPLPPFDENAYVADTNFNNREISSLLDDFRNQRKATISLFRSLTEEELSRIGTASGKSVSSKALFYFLLGHYQHHVNILKERYL